MNFVYKINKNFLWAVTQNLKYGTRKRYYRLICVFSIIVNLVRKQMLTSWSVAVPRSSWRSTVRAKIWRKAGSSCVNTPREATGWYPWSHQRLSLGSSSSLATTTSPATGGNKLWMWRMHFTLARNPKSQSVMRLPSRSWGESVCAKLKWKVEFSGAADFKMNAINAQLNCFRYVPPTWTYECDEDLVHYFYDHIGKEDENLGSVKQCVTSIDVSSCSVSKIKPSSQMKLALTDFKSHFKQSKSF